MQDEIAYHAAAGSGDIFAGSFQRGEVHSHHSQKPASTASASPVVSETAAVSEAVSSPAGPEVQTATVAAKNVSSAPAATISTEASTASTSATATSGNVAAAQAATTLKVANAPPAAVVTAKSTSIAAPAAQSSPVAKVSVNISSILPDLFSSLAANVFPTDASIAGVFELHGLIYAQSGNTLTITAASATLFPGKSFQATFSSLTASYNTSTNSFNSITASGMQLKIGDALVVQASSVGFNYTAANGPTPASFTTTIASATVKAGLFSSPTAAIALNGLTISNTGFSFTGFSLTVVTTPTLGTYLSASSMTLTVSAFSVNYATPSLTGTATVNVAGLKVFGNAVSGTVVGTYGFNSSTFDGTNPSGSLSLTVTGFGLTVAGQVKISAPGTVTITPGGPVFDSLGTVTTTTASVPLQFIPLDPTNLTVTLTAGGITQTISDYTVSDGTLKLPSLASYLGTASATSGTLTAVYAPSLISIPNATVTIVPLGLSVSISDLAITPGGFTLANATIAAASAAPVGGLLALTNPMLTLSGVSYDATAGSLLGNAAIAATGASLNFGSVAGAITQVNGSYNLGGTVNTLSLSLGELDVNLPFASLQAMNVVFSYQTGTTTAKMLLGAKNVNLILGPGSTNTSGIQVAGATLGLEVQDTANVITYAFQANGTLATVGLPANSLAFSGNVSVQVNTITSPVNDTIAFSNTPGDTLALNFTSQVSQVTGSNVSLTVGGVVTLNGNFLVTRSADNSEIYIGATGVSAFIGAPDQSVGLQLSGVTLGRHDWIQLQNDWLCAGYFCAIHRLDRNWQCLHAFRQR